MTTNLSPEEDKFLAEISQRVHWYSTPLLRLRDRLGRQPEVEQMGSGTFVYIEGIYGILTAHHVAEKFNGDYALGLILMEKTHHFVVEHGHFIIYHLAIPNQSSIGPDLSFIKLNNPKIGTIKAHKLFYNLSSIHKTVLSNILPINQGAWVIWGAPGEQNTIEPPEGDFRSIMGLHGYCSGVRAANERISNEHDYIEIEVEYGKGFNIPDSFGGYSGGGIWQVTFEEAEDLQIRIVDVILSGVAFYESEIRDQTRYITCHGRRSVYEYSYSRIMENCA